MQPKSLVLCFLNLNHASHPQQEVSLATALLSLYSAHFTDIPVGNFADRSLLPRLPPACYCKPLNRPALALAELPWV
jgi:hypothetical protein